MFRIRRFGPFRSGHLRRRRVTLLIGMIAGLILCGVLSAQREKPNIIFIMADDLGAEVLSSYGGETYDTPNLDRLAQEGTQFQNAYSTSLCTPTRAQVMTGQYPFRNGWPEGIWNKPREKQFLDPDVFNFASMLQKVGYRTAVAGKWQLARFEDRPEHATNVGFDQHSLWTWLYSKTPEHVRLERENKPSRYWDPGIWENGQLRTDTKGEFGPDLFTEFLLRFIRKNRDEPFFVYYPMAIPHWPFVPTPGMEGDRDGTRENPEAQENFEAMVAYTDRLVGRFVQTLERLNVREETLLIFTGDNGTAKEIRSRWKGRTIQGEKGNMTDAGSRVPFIASWPGVVPAGTVREDLIDFSDVLPTFAEIAGVDLPGDVTIDGRSFLPQLKGRDGTPREWIFNQVGDSWFLQTRNWRLRRNGDLYRWRGPYDVEKRSRPFTDEEERVFERLRRAVPSGAPDLKSPN